MCQTLAGKNEEAVAGTSNAHMYSAVLLGRRQLSAKTFEIELSRPPSFEFTPGQRIRFVFRDITRDYSLTSAASDSILALCVRKIARGTFSPQLDSAPIGSRFNFSGPYGYFTYHPSSRPTVFVATGTGIAPFCAMARSGVTGFTILHGVRLPEELYYTRLFQSTAKLYVPCLSGSSKTTIDFFKGRITEYLKKNLQPGPYDFYLCGRREMIRDVILMVDDQFQDSRVFTEVFF